MSVSMPAVEAATRLKRFCGIMDIDFESWRHAFIFDPTMVYYFTGTRQDGILYVPAQDLPILFVMRDYGRAMGEARFVEVVEINSLHDISSKIHINPHTIVHVDKEGVSASFLDRFKDIMELQNIVACDKQLQRSRQYKSLYEQNIMLNAGEIVSNVLDNFVPSILEADMSEYDLSIAIHKELISLGHEGVLRCHDLRAELSPCYVSFGTNSAVRGGNNVTFGCVGVSSAVPHYGSKSRKLRENEVVTVDAICNISGYHVRASRVYSVGDLSNYIKMQYTHCSNIIKRAASLMTPGVPLAGIYNAIMRELHPELEGSFMGRGEKTPNFIGHAIGIYADDNPKVGLSSSDVVMENGAYVIEPRVFIEKVGLIGVANTYQIKQNGAHSITGSADDVIIVHREREIVEGV